MELSAEQIVKQMEEGYKSLKDVKGTLVGTTNGANHSISFAMKGNKWRSEDENTIQVCNGSVTWIYYKKKNAVVILPPLSKEKQVFDYGRIIKDLTEKYVLKLVGEERISGKDCYLIEAKPKNESHKQIPELKIWVDKEFWYPLRIESDFGMFRLISEYRDVKFNTGISDEEFEFKIPEGAKIVERWLFNLTIDEAQKRVNFTIIIPNYTAGYEFSRAAVIKRIDSMLGNETVVLQFKKGDEGFAIGESINVKEIVPWRPNPTKVKIKDKEGEIFEFSSGRKILRFSSNGIVIEIQGRLSNEELIKIAESML